VASNKANKAKIRLKLKHYSDELYYMVDALKMMEEMLKDNNGTHPVYIANAMSHISKASDSLYKAAKDVEAKI
jgi:hypothetical protein